MSDVKREDENVSNGPAVGNGAEVGKGPDVEMQATMPDDKIDTTVKKPDAVVSSKPVQSTNEKAKDSKSSGGFSVWIKEIRAEFRKIVWPNRKELGKMTLTVVITSLFFGLIIAGMDTVFRSAVGFLVNLL